MGYLRVHSCNNGFSNRSIIIKVNKRLKIRKEVAIRYIKINKILIEN